MPEVSEKLGIPTCRGHRAGTASGLVLTRTGSPAGVHVRASGEIDRVTTALLIAELDAAIDGGDGPIVVDLADVTFMDCSGVNALVTAHQAAPTRLQLRNPHPAVRRVLELTGLLDVFALANQGASLSYHPGNATRP